jgi:hypothetical protein
VWVGHDGCEAALKQPEGNGRYQGKRRIKSVASVARMNIQQQSEDHSASTWVKSLECPLILQNVVGRIRLDCNPAFPSPIPLINTLIEECT